MTSRAKIAAYQSFPFCWLTPGGTDIPTHSYSHPGKVLYASFFSRQSEDCRTLTRRYVLVRQWEGCCVKASIVLRHVGPSRIGVMSVIST